MGNRNKAKLGGGMTMKKQDLSFAKLVSDINKKWGHTYEEFNEEKQGEIDLKEYLGLNNYSKAVKED